MPVDREAQAGRTAECPAALLELMHDDARTAMCAHAHARTVMCVHDYARTAMCAQLCNNAIVLNDVCVTRMRL